MSHLGLAPIVPALFVLYSISLYGFTSHVQYLLLYIKDNTGDSISESVYPIEIILWIDPFMPHNMVINNCKSFHTYMAKIGCPSGDLSGSYLYPISLGRKCDNRSNVNIILVNEINELNDKGMLLYYQEWDQIICMKAHLYVFLCNCLDKSTSFQILSSKNCSSFRHAGDVQSTIYGIIFCNLFFEELSNNILIPG